MTVVGLQAEWEARQGRAVALADGLRERPGAVVREFWRLGALAEVAARGWRESRVRPVPTVNWLVGSLLVRLADLGCDLTVDVAGARLAISHGGRLRVDDRDLLGRLKPAVLVRERYGAAYRQMREWVEAGVLDAFQHEDHQCGYVTYRAPGGVLLSATSWLSQFQGATPDTVVWGWLGERGVRECADIRELLARTGRLPADGGREAGGGAAAG